MADQNQRISDLLDALTDASSEEIETALRIFEPADVAAVVAERALAGGGGGGGSSSPVAITAGDGEPVADGVTPGDLYIDTTGGGLYVWEGEAGWGFVGGFLRYTPAQAGFAGVTVQGDGDTGSVYVLGGGAQSFGSVFLSDTLSISGPGLDNGLLWNATGTDGEQTLQVQTGPSGSTKLGTLQDAHGVLTSPGGIIFPSSDPHVAGAWWDNAGTLTKSSG